MFPRFGQCCFYNHNHRSWTYQIAMPLFYVLCTKGMSQGFSEMQLSFNNKANFLFSLTVMFLEYCTYKFHENSFKLMRLSCSVKLLSRYPFYYVNSIVSWFWNATSINENILGVGKNPPLISARQKFLKSKSLFTQNYM